MTYPNAHVFVDGPVIHHFERPGWRASRPGSKDMQEHPYDSCASQAPLDAFRLATAGGGAGGTLGYLVQDAVDADQFYAESTPAWWIPGRYYDLRDTWATFYLKEITPISVAPGFAPRLFVAAYMPEGTLPRVRGSGWFLKDPLAVGRGEWAYNEIFLTTDRASWINYYTQDPEQDTLDEVLAHCGFIGWWYQSETAYRGAHANGTIGWDELHYNLSATDLQRLRAGQPLDHALEF